MNTEDIEKKLAELKPSDPLPEDLDNIIESISINGISNYPWDTLQKLLTEKTRRSLNQSNKMYPFKAQDGKSYDDQISVIFDELEKLESIPFTIQRICELLTETNGINVYKNTNKYIMALQKVLNIYLSASTLYKESQPIVNLPGTMPMSLDQVPISDFDPETKAPW
ncbi:hypothetical protein WA158_000798 [Blastocystis sp. Blastoise]